MRKLFVITFGWDERFALRFLFRREVEKDDKILIITGKIDEKVKKGLDNLLRAIESLGKPEIKVIEAEKLSFFETIKKVKEEMNNVSKVQASLSGGMRWIVVATFLALLLVREKVKEIEIQKENLEGGYILRGKFIRALAQFFSLSSLEKEILYKIYEGKTDIKLLSEALKKDKTTIRRHIQKLKDFLIIKKRKPLIIQPEEYLKVFL